MFCVSRKGRGLHCYQKYHQIKTSDCKYLLRQEGKRVKREVGRKNFCLFTYFDDTVCVFSLNYHIIYIFIYIYVYINSTIQTTLLTVSFRQFQNFTLLLQQNFLLSFCCFFVWNFTLLSHLKSKQCQLTQFLLIFFFEV